MRMQTTCGCGWSSCLLHVAACRLSKRQRAECVIADASLSLLRRSCRKLLGIRLWPNLEKPERAWDTNVSAWHSHGHLQC